MHSYFSPWLLDRILIEIRNLFSKFVFENEVFAALTG